MEIAEIKAYIDRHTLTTVLLCGAMELVNIVEMNSLLNLLLTLPQLLLVLYFVVRRKLKEALFFHLLFMAVSFSATSAITDSFLFSYGKMKAIGPITMSYLVGICIFFLVWMRYPVIEKDCLLYKFYKMLVILCSFGVGIGLVGIALWDYPIEYFMRPAIYMFVGIIHIDPLLRLYHEEDFKELFYTIAICLLVASPMVSFFSFFVLGYTTRFSTEAAFYYNEIYFHTPCLLIALTQIRSRKYKTLIISALIFYFANAVAAARGLMIYTMIFAIVLYLLAQQRNAKGISISTWFATICTIATLCLFVVFSEDKMSKLTMIKFEQVLAFQHLFDFSGDWRVNLKQIPVSPYVRISEALNCLHNGIENPVGLLFGKGYGGSYTDSLHLFTTSRYFLGAYSQEVVASGKFTTAHDAIPCLLLYNGLLGLVMSLKMGFLYAKHTRIAFPCFAGIFLCWLSFYFNPLYLTSGAILLFGAEAKLCEYENTLC